MIVETRLKGLVLCSHWNLWKAMNTPPPDIFPDLVVEDSNAEAAIPVMHISLASICFMCNFFLPGSGNRSYISVKIISVDRKHL